VHFLKRTSLPTFFCVANFDHKNPQRISTASRLFERFFPSDRYETFSCREQARRPRYGLPFQKQVISKCSKHIDQQRFGFFFRFSNLATTRHFYAKNKQDKSKIDIVLTKSLSMPKLHTIIDMVQNFCGDFSPTINCFLSHDTR